MEVGIIGYGAIAGIHARALADEPDVTVTAWGPSWDRTRAFAGSSLVPRRRLADLLASADAVIVASPSPFHESHTAAALRAGRSAFVEIPSCSDGRAGRRLAARAMRAGAILRGAHTSRYLAGFALAGSCIADGRLGRIEHVAYERDVPRRLRTWTDDALRHHAFHPVDLFTAWFGAGSPVAAAIERRAGAAYEVGALLAFPRDIEAHVSIRYGTSMAVSRLRIDGTAGRLETDGFSSVIVNGRSLGLRNDPDAAYLGSVRAQDADLLASLRGIPAGPDWDETLRTILTLDAIAACAAATRAS